MPSKNEMLYQKFQMIPVNKQLNKTDKSILFNKIIVNNHLKNHVLHSYQHLPF